MSNLFEINHKMETVLKKNNIKKIFKEALIEVFETRKDILQEAVAEALEEMGLYRAIKEGEKNNLVKEQDIMKYLNKRIKKSKN